MVLGNRRVSNCSIRTVSGESIALRESHETVENREWFLSQHLRKAVVAEAAMLHAKHASNLVLFSTPTEEGGGWEGDERENDFPVCHCFNGL